MTSFGNFSSVFISRPLSSRACKLALLSHFGKKMKMLALVGTPFFEMSHVGFLSPSRVSDGYIHTH
jgi:hypothetical protein